ncbi:NmrA/HSCARG family protein [Kribbella sp. NBC_01245]|uniref:NmrA/HSCARG family protein n=1 Tax=Kribbella sp. NBC_01245 TaxID=2903578 RepID=UPI002E29AD48|nr:NmrA/HSCARG family protein [Kribbella sp. NBC_01245]
MDDDKLVAVTGATGRQGGAVLRHLLADGWQVRALTRTPNSIRAQALKDLGAEVVACDMADRDSLVKAFAGARGVYSVQNPMIAGFDGEVAQGKNVADAAKAAGVLHVVYGGAGPGLPGTGVDSWESKLIVADYVRELGIPLTVLRPMAFMELMTDKDLYPPVAMWRLMPKFAGADTPIPWLAVDDLGVIAARVFADPETFVGTDLPLAGEIRSVEYCRQTWQRVMGRAPRSFPMPVWLFERFTGKDLTTMWRWLARNEVSVDPQETSALLGSVTTVERFVAARR